MSWRQGGLSLMGGLEVSILSASLLKRARSWIFHGLDRQRLILTKYCTVVASKLSRKGPRVSHESPLCVFRSYAQRKN